MVDHQISTGFSPHEHGNYFLGQVVDDPGPLFYPVAFAFRASPLLCLGLLAAFASLLLWLSQPAEPGAQAPNRRGLKGVRSTGGCSPATSAATTSAVMPASRMPMAR